MSVFEVEMTLVACGWAAVAVWMNGQRLKWRQKAMRLEREARR